MAKKKIREAFCHFYKKSYFMGLRYFIFIIMGNHLGNNYFLYKIKNFKTIYTYFCIDFYFG